jgi:hypothetical protein
VSSFGGNLSSPAPAAIWGISGFGSRRSPQRFEATHNDLHAAIKHMNPQEIHKYGGMAQAAVNLPTLPAAAIGPIPDHPGNRSERDDDQCGEDEAHRQSDRSDGVDCPSGLEDDQGG